MKYLATIAAVALVSAGPGFAQSGSVKPADIFGYVGDDKQRYDSLVKEYASYNCSKLRRENKRHGKIANSGKSGGGEAVKALGGLLGSSAKSTLDGATKVSKSAQKESKMRYDASGAVMEAKKC